MKKSFHDFIKEGIIKKITPNKERAKSLVDESERKTHSLNEQIEKIGVKNENANDYVEYCYDIIMYLIRAKLFTEGYSSSGYGAHEAEVSYLEVLGFDESDVQFTDQMRYFRNGVLYYGTSLDAEYAKKCIEFSRAICNKLRQILSTVQD